jgi:hypothetical protein
MLFVFGALMEYATILFSLRHNKLYNKSGSQVKDKKQVGTPTLPTAIPLKSSSSMRATLVFNLFLNETMLVFNP